VPAAPERTEGPWVYPETADFGMPPISRGAPTRLLIAAKRRMVFTCTRNMPTSTLAAFHIEHDGQLALIGYTDNRGGWNLRDCALSPDEEWLVDLDSSSGLVSAYRIGDNGTLTHTATAAHTLDYPSSMMLWAPADACLHDDGVPASAEALEPDANLRDEL